ncbi:MAG: methyltransferase domain-containing protein [Nitrososphaeria archaeon]|nr:methyltransferase domain-containing protein [Nitrososphaeria archaeon]
MYLPAEDTFLLIRGLDSYNNLGKVLEIGLGSGKVAELINERSEFYVGCDINFNVLKEFKTKNVFNLKIDLVCCDSASCFRSLSFDTIIFNPPYLPSESIEDITIDGGYEGCEVTIAFLKNSFRLLKVNGLIFFIASTLSNLSKITSFLKENNFSYEEILREKFLFEHIILYKCMKLA